MAISLISRRRIDHQRTSLGLSLLPGVLLFMLLIAELPLSRAFVQNNFVTKIRLNVSQQSALFLGKIDNDENADLLEKAQRLREEASRMEDDLRATTPAAISSPNTEALIPTVNTQLEESIWTLSYRFSSQPSPKESDNSDNSESLEPKVFYSGKFDLLLKQDGYSEKIQQITEAKENDIEIVKIWGWDKETSNEDNLEYLLFSMDIKFPKSDPDLSSQTERYYFQARVEQDISTDKSIALKEGTITVKKDVTEKTGGMWGLFNVAGILTEFRYCGDFVARATSSPK